MAYVYTFKHRKVKERGSNVAWRKEEKKKSLVYVANKKHKENNRSLCTDKISRGCCTLMPFSDAALRLI